MTPEWVHPGLILIAGAWMLPLLPARTRRFAMVLLPAVALVDCILMEPGTYGLVRFMGQELVFGRVDRLSLVFSYVFALMSLLGMVYALHVDDGCEGAVADTRWGSPWLR